MRKLLFFLLLIVVVGLGIAYYQHTLHAKRTDQLTLFGNVDVRQVDLGFRVGGRVATMLFEEGQFVPSGTLMARLDVQPYLDQITQAQASVQSAKIILENAITLFKRRNELVQDGSISTEDFENAQTNKANYEASLKQAEASLAIAQSNYNFTELYSPADGVILTRIREPGTAVRETDPIYTLSLITPVWIRAYVSEPELGLIYPNMEAEIITDTPNGKVYRGHIGFISPVAEFTPKSVETTQLRTDLVYRLRIIADNPDEGLRQGMPVTVRLKMNQSQ